MNRTFAANKNSTFLTNSVFLTNSIFLTGLILLGLSGPALLTPSPALAVTQYTQAKTADQLVKQFKAASGDAAKMAEAITALQGNPKAVDKIMKGTDPALKKAFLKQDALLRSQQVAGRWQSVQEADALVKQTQAAMAGNNPAAKQKAILNLLDNSEAVNRLNRYADPALKKAISKKIRGLQNETKALIRQRAAARLGVPPEQIVFVNTTHASAVPKVGQDWDLTIRIVDETIDPNTGKALRKVRDVKPHKVADIVQESFYQATTGKVPPTEAKALQEYRKAAAAHSEAKSLELTWAMHKEAIGGGIKEGSQLVKGRLPIRDAEQLSLVAEYKAQHPVVAEVKQIEKAALEELRALGLKPGDPKAQAILTRAQAQAHKLQVERARTYLKMFDKHIAPRVGHYGGKVPKQIEQANLILRQLADDTIDVGKASRQLGEIGLSIDDVVYKSSGLVDAAKTLRAPATIAKPAGFFSKNWNKIINGKLSGPALKAFGHTLGAAFVAGEYSKGLLDEMDIAIAEDRELNGGYALVRAWDTGIKEPAYMVADLLGKGVEGGALYVGGKMQDFVDLNKAFYDKASEQGLIDAFGETYVAALKKRWQEGTLWESTKSGTAWAWNKGTEGLDYAWNHPGQTLDKVDESLYQGTLTTGEFLGIKAVGDLIYRDVETEVLNDITLRDNTVREAVNLREKATELRALLDTLKRQVRKGDPANPGVTANIEATAERYAKGYGVLKQHYNAFWSRLYRNHGGLKNPAIVRAMDAMKGDLAVVNALPANPFDFLSDRFIQGLLSKVTVTLNVPQAADGEPATPGNTSGFVQFNAAGTDKVCRGSIPRVTCGGLPPGNYQLRAKFGDYAEATRSLVINPLIRRHYQTGFNLDVEAPLWAWITVNVRDVETRASIPGARVRFSSDAEAARSSTTSTGALRINQVLAGRVSVSASAEGYESNASRFTIDTLQQTEYDLELYLQPIAPLPQDMATDDAPVKKTSPGSTDCSQIDYQSNVNFSTWSCCKDEFERTQARSLCNGVGTKLASKTLNIRLRMRQWIKEQEGGQLKRGTDYGDYTTPWGTSNGISACAKRIQADICRKLGSPLEDFDYSELDASEEDSDDSNVVCQHVMGTTKRMLCKSGQFPAKNCKRVDEIQCCRTGSKKADGSADCWTRQGDLSDEQADKGADKGAEKEREAKLKEQAEQEKARACYKKHAEVVQRAHASNAAQDPSGNMGLVSLSATPACAKAYKACTDAMWKKGDACWKAGNPPSVCNPKIGQMQIDCAQQDVACSASAWKEQCGVKE